MRIMIIKNRRQKDDHEFHQRNEHMRGNFKQGDEGDDKKTKYKKDEKTTKRISIIKNIKQEDD